MRHLEVIQTGDKKFRITIPDDSKVTFGPWSPPKNNNLYEVTHATGTLRIYKGTKDNIIACYSDVVSFRDLSLGYAEQVAKEEGATIWKDDEKGYVREHKVSVQREWVNPARTLEAMNGNTGSRQVNGRSVGKRSGIRSKKSS